MLVHQSFTNKFIVKNMSYFNMMKSVNFSKR